MGFVFSRLIVDRTLTLTDCQTPPGVDGKFVAVVSIHRYKITVSVLWVLIDGTRDS